MRCQLHTTDEAGEVVLPRYVLGLLLLNADQGVFVTGLVHSGEVLSGQPWPTL